MISGHPRPQLTRPSFSTLDGAWGFAFDPADTGVADRWFLRDDIFDNTIQVPFPPESVASGIGRDVDCPMWYHRQLDLDPEPETRQLLHFEGVDHRATIWLNGVHLADHEGSQARFTCDITNAARKGANALVVRVIDEQHNLEQPRGKQDWQPKPHVIWYRRTSGIWRTVWTETVPSTWIDQLHLEPQPDLRSVRFSVRLAGRSLTEPRVRLVLRHGDQLLADLQVRCGPTGAHAVIALDHECLDAEPERLQWTPETPTIIDAEITLSDTRRVIDNVRSYLGIRTVGVDRGHVLLNGRPYFLRLVLEQAYWPHTHLAAPSTAALEDEARLIRQLGFNGVRMHQVSADPRFLECCDRLGLLVLADAAAAYRFSTTAVQRTAHELLAVLERDINHPSLIAWVPFNESWGLPSLQTNRTQQHAVEALYHLLKALDPSRIALGNDGWHHVVGDLIGVHDYSQDAGVLRSRYGTRSAIAETLAGHQPAGRPLTLRGGTAAQPAPVVLTEFGGISSHDDPSAWRAYGDVVSFDGLAAAVGDLVAAVGASSGLAGFCYTQLTDTEQEKNGLLTEARTFKCAPADIRRAILGLASQGSNRTDMTDTQRSTADTEPLLETAAAPTLE